MLSFVRHHLGLSLAFLLACLLTVVFLVRLIVATVVWSNPDNLDQPIAGWMTPRYVVKSWQVAPEVVAGALDLKGAAAGRMVTLDEIAARQGRPLDDLLRDLDAAIARSRGQGDG